MIKPTSVQIWKNFFYGQWAWKYLLDFGWPQHQQLLNIFGSGPPTSLFHVFYCRPGRLYHKCDTFHTFEGHQEHGRNISTIPIEFFGGTWAALLKAITLNHCAKTTTFIDDENFECQSNTKSTYFHNSDRVLLWYFGYTTQS